jgi:thioredoxin reductase (NADPH)
METCRTVDSLIVGGGPAGLTAATYLGRFRRSVVLVDSGESRVNRIPLSRNIPGFPDGISGQDFLARMRDQAGKYGATLLEGQVNRIAPTGDGFTLLSTCGEWVARTVLLATGVHVVDPPVEELAAAVERGLIRYCPICDGYEAIGSRVAVLGGRPHAIEEAHFLRHYVSDLTFVCIGGGAFPTTEAIAKARAAGIDVEESTCIGMAIVGDAVELHLENDASASFDIVYPCLGTEPRSDLAMMIGAAISVKGELLTDKHQQTNIPGIYAAGDVLRGLDQVASACGQAAIAATAIHNTLGPVTRSSI